MTSPASPHIPPLPPVKRAPRTESPRLGGALAVIFWCACGITAVPLATVFSLIALVGPEAALSTTLDALGGDTLAARVLRFGALPQIMLFLWGASFVVLTVARSRLALTFAPLGLAAWVIFSAVGQFAIRDALTPDGLTAGDIAALLPSLLIQVISAAALYGYFKEGARPRAYYVR